jgi:hypothetical protein
LVIYTGVPAKAQGSLDKMAEGYDYVIVGGGSAGCAMAARLSEMPDARVLLIEAGPKDTDPYIHMPVGFFKMTAGPLIWGYKTQPLAHANNRTAVYPQARVLGGGPRSMQKFIRVASQRITITGPRTTAAMAGPRKTCTPISSSPKATPVWVARTTA